MKVLQLCHKPPKPSVDGGCLAMDALTKGLLDQGHEVKILSIHTSKHPYLKNKLDDSYLKMTSFESIFVDTRVNIVDAFSNLFTQDSYNINRFFSAAFDIRLKNLLQSEKFDIIQFESLFMMPYLSTVQRHSKGKRVLRSHNLEYLIWQRMADSTKNVAKKLYLKHLAKKLELFELDVIKKVHGIVTITKEDYEKYSSLNAKKSNLITIPFGINLAEYSEEDPPEEISLFHLGSLEWPPNLEGVTWFLEHIWPAIREEFPQLVFYLAGRKIPTKFNEENYPGIKVVGEVADAKKFISSKSIMLVPILSAGGMRVKIIEGMALGKIILSTKLGAEGIDFKENKDIYLADTKRDFLKNIRDFHENPEKINTQKKVSREFVCANFDNQKLIIKLTEFYLNLLDK
ncbi:MAG: glycosyltransferase family 4 protein [Flavobacteriales bacterium]